MAGRLNGEVGRNTVYKNLTLWVVSYKDLQINIIGKAEGQ